VGYRTEAAPIHRDNAAMNIAGKNAPWSQVVLMAAIVATLMCLPLGALLASFGFAVLGIPFHAFLTFGSALGELQGLLAWWTLAFLAAVPYVLFFYQGMITPS
jgi:hypothetical protein